MDEVKECDDVWMTKSCRRSRFAGNAFLDTVSIGRIDVRNLDGDESIELTIVGAENRTESASTELFVSNETLSKINVSRKIVDD